jgi:hypothetical protein
MLGSHLNILSYASESSESEDEGLPSCRKDTIVPEIIWKPSKRGAERIRRPKKAFSVTLPYVILVISIENE